MTIIMAILKFAAAFGMLGDSDMTKVVLAAGKLIDRVVATLLTTPLPLHLQWLVLFFFIGAGLLLARKAAGIIRKWAVVTQVVRVLRSPLVHRHGRALLTAVGPRMKRDPVPTVDEMLRCQRADQGEPVKNPRKKIRRTTVCPPRPRILRTNAIHKPGTTDDLVCLVGPSFQLRTPEYCVHRRRMSQFYKPGYVHPILKPSRYSKKFATVEECNDLEEELEFQISLQSVSEFRHFGELKPDHIRRRNMERCTMKHLKKRQQRQRS